MTDLVVLECKKWLGEDGVRYFKHLKGLTGEYSPLLTLNDKRKGFPFHSVHFNEGMQIRNWMRTQSEFENYTAHDFDDNWMILIEKVCNLK